MRHSGDTRYIRTKWDKEKSFDTDKLAVTVTGKGAKIKKLEEVKKRAKRKIITQSMILALIDVTKRKGTWKRKNAYWNTYHCQSHLISSNHTLYGGYCKNRFCTICSCIRKAEIINKYLPVIKTWDEPYFVTLTVKSCYAKKLNKMVEAMIRAFRLIINRYKKRYQRGKGIKLMGIKSLECNFNPTKRTYNPHFHIIVPDKIMAENLVNEWLNLWTKKFTNRKAQYYRKVENTERDLMEIIKYGSKIFTEPTTKKKSKNKKTTRFIYISALDNIFSAMSPHRIFDRFGFNLPKDLVKKSSQFSILHNFKEWKFEPKLADWVNVKTGEKMSNYTVPFELEELLNSCIDKDLE